MAPWDESSALATIAERAREPETVYAELQMTIESSAARGVFDAVVLWTRSPRRLRMVGFRDTLVSIQEIFDLRIEGDRYRLAFRDPDGESERSEGAVGSLRVERPELRTLADLREGLFLPGRVPADATATLDLLAAGGPCLRVRQSDGIECDWTLAPGTLAVRRARFAWPDGHSALVTYWSWEMHGGRLFPREVEITEPGVSVTGRVRALEIDEPLDAEAFLAPDELP